MHRNSPSDEGAFRSLGNSLALLVGYHLPEAEQIIHINVEQHLNKSLILYFKCPSCNKESKFKSDSQTRVDLSMKHGNKMDLECSICSQTISIPINKTYAKTDKTLFLILGLIFLVGSAVILVFVGDMILNYEITKGTYIVATTLVIPVWIYIILKQKDSLRVKTFNQTYVKD